MTTIKATENEFKIQLISWLNEFISHGNYPFEVTGSRGSLKILEFPQYI